MLLNGQQTTALWLLKKVFPERDVKVLSRLERLTRSLLLKRSIVNKMTNFSLVKTFYLQNGNWPGPCKTTSVVCEFIHT